MDSVKTVDFGDSKEYLDKLFELHNKICRTRRENAERIIEVEKENKEMKQLLLDLFEIKTLLQEERTSWQQKLQNIEQKQLPKDFTKNFDTVCHLLGYSLSDLEWDTEHNIQYVKCFYNKEYSIQFGISTSGAKDLLEIIPQHPNFEYIQEHFRNTQDSTSLLANLRKYFDYCENAEKHT